jgi:uncharacterized protein
MSVVNPSSSVLRPLGPGDVILADGFWGSRQEVNHLATIPHSLSWMERLGWIANFTVANEGRTPLDRRGRGFTDANVYNLLEALTWETDRSRDESLQAVLDRITSVVGFAQEPDGYLNTRYGHQGAAIRYSDLEWGHELFCYGHLIQAGVADLRTGRSGELSQIARRAADHVCETFGPGGNPGLCGHPEIEMALVELGRATGEQRYVDQAALFIERRGKGLLRKIEFGQQYFQDDIPVREAGVLRGHVVRALYLAAGALDVGLETGDDELVQSVADQYNRAIATRTYLTGGMGSRHADESFGFDFELPPDSAYCETCAGIASVMVAWRLLLATGDAVYADIVERTLFNLVATSPSLSGIRFFYANTLHQREPGTTTDSDQPSPRAASGLRASWFDVACCPTNLIRTLPALSMYFATADTSGIQIHQYGNGAIATGKAGPDTRLEVVTDYPFGPDVRVRVVASTQHPWTLMMRVPEWCKTATLVVDGRTESASPGYVSVRRTWRPDDELVLSLPMVPRWVAPDFRIDACRGSVALERGPLVYCIESVDQTRPLDSVVIDCSQPVRDDSEPVGLSAMPALQVEGATVPATQESWPYDESGSDRPDRTEAVTMKFIPYYAWGNRGASTMRVWVPAQSGLDSRPARASESQGITNVSRLDIEQPAALIAYLRQRQAIGIREVPTVTVLAGGVSSRVVLVRRVNGEAWILKQSLPKLRVAVDWFSDPQRVHREAKALRWLPELGLRVPAFRFEDFDHHLLAMDAVPEPHENWKTMLLQGRLEMSHVEAWAGMLAQLHIESARRLAEIDADFQDRTFFESLRIEPYYLYTAGQVPEAGEFLAEVVESTRAHRLCLVHGDFSPKNVLIYQQQLVLLDHEVAHYGDPAFDMGFSMTHLLSKAHHLPEHRTDFLEAAVRYWSVYRDAIQTEPWSDRLEGRAIRSILACLLARVAGRSQLEYLDQAERANQKRVTLLLMAAPPITVNELISSFGANV